MTDSMAVGVVESVICCCLDGDGAPTRRARGPGARRRRDRAPARARREAERRGPARPHATVRRPLPVGRGPVRVEPRARRGLRPARRARHEPCAVRQLARRRAGKRGAHGPLAAAGRSRRAPGEGRSGPARGPRLPGERRAAGRDDLRRHGRGRRPHPDPGRDGAEPARHARRRRGQQPLHPPHRAGAPARARRQGRAPGGGAPARGPALRPCRGDGGHRPLPAVRRGPPGPRGPRARRLPHGRRQPRGRPAPVRGQSGQWPGGRPGQGRGPQLPPGLLRLDARAPRRRLPAALRVRRRLLQLPVEAPRGRRDHAPLSQGPGEARPPGRAADGQELGRGGAAPVGLDAALRDPEGAREGLGRQADRGLPAEARRDRPHPRHAHGRARRARRQSPAASIAGSGPRRWRWRSTSARRRAR